MSPGLLIAAKEVTAYYYRFIAYSELFRQKELTKLYKEGVMAVTLKQFSMLVFTIPNKSLDGRGVAQTTWTMIALFCCMRYISDPKYLCGNRTTEMVKR